MKTLKLLTTGILFLSIMSVNAQVTGDWKGTLNVPGMDMELIFHITDNNGTYSATMDVPLQGATGIEIDKVALENDEITLSSAMLQMTFKGKIAGETIEGTFGQMGMSLPLTLTKFESKLPGDISLPSSDEELKKLIEYQSIRFQTFARRQIYVVQRKRRQ